MARFTTRLVTMSFAIALLAHSLPAAENVLTPFLKDVRKTVLPNGLTVLTRTQPGVGVVAIDTWVKAGYFNEPDEVAGMAHLFEHMFFKGSKKFPGAEQISQELSSVGGQTNAGTIYDSTNYYFVVPKEGFRRGVEIQADALNNPLFDPIELKKEAEVVIEESNRKFDNPPAVASERMYATAFTTHRMKRWRIGSNEVLRNIKRDNLLAFFETLYRPENIIVSIAGDVTHEEALQAVRATFGMIPRGKLAKKVGPAEPVQKEFRFGQSSSDLRQAYTELGWHTVAENHPDELTLDVLADILGSGRSSRFFRNVVAPDAASQASASHFTFGDVGVFEVSASFDEKNRGEVDRRIIREVERIKAHGPTDYELQLARNGIEAGLLLGVEQVLGQAQTLASLESRGSYQDLGKRLDRLAAITPANIQEAARKYLTLENMTLYHYRPKGAAEMTREAALAAVQAAMKDTPPAPEKIELPKVTSSVRRSSGDRPVQRIALDNGATLVVRERRGAPVVTTGIFFPGGRFHENNTNAGITQLMTRGMRRGTTTRTGEQIDREIEFLGTQIGTRIRDDYFSFTLSIPTKSWRGGLDLLSDVILHPTFPEGGVKEEKFQQLAAIKRAFDSSTTRPSQLGNAAFFGSHPYGLPEEGTATSLDSIGRDALQDWWEREVVSDGALIVVVGDVSTEDVSSTIRSAFESLPRAKGARANVPPPVIPAAHLDVTEFRDKKQSAIMMTFPTVPPSHPDWAAFDLLGEVTSGLAGTFFAELRGKRSLAYTVFATDSPRVTAGTFIAYLASDATKEDEARKGLLGEVRKLQGEGIKDADVDRARKSFVGSTLIQLQTNAALVNELAWNHFYGLGLDFTEKHLEQVKKLTSEDLRAVAKKYLSGDQYVVATVSGKKVEREAGTVK